MTFLFLREKVMVGFFFCFFFKGTGSKEATSMWQTWHPAWSEGARGNGGGRILNALGNLITTKPEASIETPVCYPCKWQSDLLIVLGKGQSENHQNPRIKKGNGSSTERFSSQVSFISRWTCHQPINWNTFAPLKGEAGWTASRGTSKSKRKIIQSHSRPDDKKKSDLPTEHR